MTLPAGYRHRTASSTSDYDRLASFSASLHGATLDPMIHDMAAGLPGMGGEDWSLVETDAGELVSTLCLIPWTVSLDGVELPVGEMGIVGTAADHRGRGLVAAQAAWFRQRLAARGCLLSLIEGIPYFYRQFGFSYAFELEGGIRVVASDLPAPPTLGVRLRPGTPADLPALHGWFAAGSANLAVHTVRDETTWAWVLATSCLSEVLVVETTAGQALGYVRIPSEHFGPELTLREASPLGYEAAVATLAALLALAAERGRPGLRLGLAETNSLVQLARSLGCHDLGRYAWQVMLPDPVALLATLTPALNQRLAGSAFAAWDGTLRLGWYRGAAALHIAAGRVQAVEPADAGDASFPPDAFTALVLGWRTVDELDAQYPDVSVPPAQKWLLDTLFPRRAAFLHGHL